MVFFFLVVVKKNILYLNPRFFFSLSLKLKWENQVEEKFVVFVVFFSLSTKHGLN